MFEDKINISLGIKKIIIHRWHLNQRRSKRLSCSLLCLSNDLLFRLFSTCGASTLSSKTSICLILEKKQKNKKTCLKMLLNRICVRYREKAKCLNISLNCECWMTEEAMYELHTGNRWTFTWDVWQTGN